MDIPLSILLLFCLIFVIIGAVIMLLLQYYVYLKFTNLPEESAAQKHINVKYSLPLDIKHTARAINASLSSSSSNATASLHSNTTPPLTNDGNDLSALISLNFVMQFLFHELKNSNRVRKWFYQKLSLELDELIAKTTIGKLFDKLTIKELELGDQFPEIKNLRLHDVQLNECEGRIENLDLLLDLHYAGNFRTSIDADMVLGKKGSLTLKVKQLSGMARLQFTRKPYSHWSLSFLGDPQLNLAIESKYQGRQMQSNITSLISNQIRKAVRRKHTLPNYKLRYKPFFHKTPEEDVGDSDIQPNGVLEVKVAELSRLFYLPNVTDIYCTLTKATIPFVEVRQQDDRHVIVSLDIDIHKAKNQQIGIIFKHNTEHFVEIDEVLPNTPAFKSNLRKGDIVHAIDDKRISSMQQISKVIKGLQETVFTFRIERSIPGIIRNDAILEDLKLDEYGSDVSLNFSGASTKTYIDQPESGVKQLMARHNSGERGTSTESSLSNTPTSSPKKSNLITKAVKKTIGRDASDSNKDDTENKTKVSYARAGPRTGEDIIEVEQFSQHSTVQCSYKSLIHMDDLSSYKLNTNDRFLNLCVYGKSQHENLLLGFTNISLNNILTECAETSLRQCFKMFQLNPPIPQDIKSFQLSNQSGFNPNFCFGDILLAFAWNGNFDLVNTDTLAKVKVKSKTKTGSQFSNPNDPNYTKTTTLPETTTSMLGNNQTRTHNFIRTHFQRATQCEFCGKKIWLKDAVQCRDCSMCCHKKCIIKCQNATVCGPVDCSAVLQQSYVITSSSNSSAPEFTVTQAEGFETVDIENAVAALEVTEKEDIKAKPSTIPISGLEVHRSSLTGLLTQGIKRVNSANNLAIPGIMSSFNNVKNSTVSCAPTESISNSKSLPPSPQQTPSRRPSLLLKLENPFETVTQSLEALAPDILSLNSAQIGDITEPIINLSKNDDIMVLAKSSSRYLYSDVPPTERVHKINQLLSKVRVALDCETANHLTQSTLDDSLQQNSPTEKAATNTARSEERVQALSVIMLYLCTGLQQAQGMALQ